MAKNNASCFVISPIGKDGSDTRKRSDQVLKHIIGPAVAECGYGEPLRGDQIDRPGVITSQVIENIVNADLVVADLTDHNANVFYELAIRHIARRPVVQIIHAAQQIPFDVAATRVIKYDHQDLDQVDQARAGIVKQVQAAEVNPDDVDNPITMTLDLSALQKSNEPIEAALSEILAVVRRIANRPTTSGNTYVGQPVTYTPTQTGAWLTDPPTNLLLNPQAGGITILGDPNSPSGGQGEFKAT